MVFHPNSIMIYLCISLLNLLLYRPVPRQPGQESKDDRRDVEGYGDHKGGVRDAVSVDLLEVLLDPDGLDRRHPGLAGALQN